MNLTDSQLLTANNMNHLISTIFIVTFLSIIWIDHSFGGKFAKPLIEFDNSDLDDDTIFYSNYDSMQSLDGEQSLTDLAEQNQLNQLVMNIISNTTKDEDRCQRYKSQINEICLAKFIARTRLRPSGESVESSTEGRNDKPSEQRPTTVLPSPQQICCEFRLTYLRCLLSTVNFICPITEFNSMYHEISGLSEICSRYFAKSSRKCRKRYRNRGSTTTSTTPEPSTLSSK